MARLPREWEIQAVDLPGLGSIPARPDIGSYDDLVEYVGRMLGAPSVVVAQSMSSYIAIELALRHGSAVTHLVLSAATGGVGAEQHATADWRGEYASSFPSAAPWASTVLPDISDRLTGLTLPALLIWATDDAWSPLAVGEKLKHRVRRSRLMTFQTDDHWLARRFSAEAAAAIESFIDGRPVWS
jgi:pimeloyl-ACP methyl ester carboxylesterase